MPVFTECDICEKITGRLFTLGGKSYCARCFIKRRATNPEDNVRCPICNELVSKNVIVANLIDKFGKKTSMCASCYLLLAKDGVYYYKFNRFIDNFSLTFLQDDYASVIRTSYLEYPALELINKTTCSCCKRVLPKSLVIGNCLINGREEFDNLCYFCLSRECNFMEEVTNIYSCAICNHHVTNPAFSKRVFIGQSNYNHMDICNDCQVTYMNSFYYCCECENLYSSPPTSGRGMCNVCYRNREDTFVTTSLFPCWTKPPIEFYDAKEKPKFYFGVELELDSESAQPRHRFIEDITRSGENWIVKEDASLTFGIEFVTSPLSLKYHKQMFNWEAILDSAEESNLEPKETCGLHIHVNKFSIEGVEEKVINKADMVKIDAFVSRYKVYCDLIARRESNAYSYAKSLKPYNILGKSGEHGRYHKINLTGEDTVEFRMFASTLNKDDIFASLEFVQSLLEFSSLHNINYMITNPDCLDEYIEYVNLESEYTNLQTVIN